MDMDDPSIVANVTWCLADIAVNNPHRILELGCLSKLLELVLHPHLTIRGAALRCLSLVAFGDGLGARILVAKGFIVVIGATLRLSHSEVYVDAMWALSVLASFGPWFVRAILKDQRTLLSAFARMKGSFGACVGVVPKSAPTIFKTNHYCLSVHRSVCPSVRPSVCLLV